MQRLLRLAHELRLLKQAFRNWPSVAIAGLLWRHLPLPQRDLTIVSRRGTRLVVPLGERAGALHPVLQVFAFSAYAHDWRLEGEPCVVDIGAHVGAFTLWLAESYPSLRAVCFEPDPDAFRYLVRNTRGLAARPLRRAVGSSTRTGRLERPIPGGGVSALTGAAPANAVTVEVESFEEVMAGLGDVALLKLDCEGCEYEVVLDSPDHSWERVRRVVLEYHACRQHEPQELVDRLGSLGLSLVGADGVDSYWFAR